MGGARRVAMLAVSSVLGLVSLAACANDSTPTPTPDEDEHVSELIGAINQQLELRPGHENIRATLVLVNGRTVIERYEDSSQDQHWDIGWCTTAVVATLIGIAIDEGRIPGLDATLRELLPDHLSDMRPAVGALTLRDVLIMNGGFRGTRTSAVFDYASAADPVGDILRAAQPTPNRPFAYSTEGAHVLAAIVAESTGMSVLDYARAKLFDPLGIDTTPAYERPASEANMDDYEAADFAWPVDSTSLNLGGSSLKLAPADLAKLGQLYLDRGRWKGRQLVSTSWVRESTGVQEHNVAQPSDNFSGYGGYGYGWWLIESDLSPAFFVADPSGQLLEVLPTHSLVVVVASEPDYDNLAAGITPNALTFLVSDVIGPAYAPDGSGE